MTPPLELAWRALTTAVGLYGRNFGTFTALCLVPAAARFAAFAGVSWRSGAIFGIVELVVAGFRIALLFAALRSVWPQGLDGLKQSLSQGSLFCRFSWQEVVWQGLLIALVDLALNLGAGWLGRISAQDPALQTANEFVIKNLFIIPFTTLYLLVAVKVTLRL